MPYAPPVHRPQGKRAPQPKAQPIRAKTTALGYDWRWRKVSRQYLTRFPLCAACEANGVLTAATEVDHIAPHRGDQSLFWDESNWQPLCKRCHSRKTSGEVRGNASILPAWIGKTSRPLTVVAGPPASGKTTYVAQRAGPRDMVLDTDQIATEIGVADARNGDDRDRFMLVIRERNSRLADYVRGRTDHPRCWLIATAGSFKQRKFWADMGAEVVVVNPGAAICRQRILAESSTDEAKRSRLRAVERWQ